LTHPCAWKLSLLFPRTILNFLVPVQVTALLEDSLKFKDTLNIMVTDGGDYSVALTANGHGSLILCEELASGTVHFGPQFTARPFSREIVLFNAGKRPQTLNWMNESRAVRSSASSRVEEPEEGDQSAKKRLGRVATSPLGESNRANTLGPIDESATEQREESGSVTSQASPALKRSSSSKPEGDSAAQKEQATVFKISPEQATIVPGGSCTFTISGLASKPGAIQEAVGRKATLGKNSCPLYSILLEADVTVPLLHFSSEKLTWAQAWDPAQEQMAEESQPLTIKNVSKLPLSFSLRCQQPFSLDRLFLNLDPDEESKVYVSFDPAFATGRLTSTAKGKLIVQYSDNPQKDSIELVGEVQFPNLKMEPAKIDFGSVLNDTIRRTQVTLTNVSALPVRYSWAFLEGDADDIHVSSAGSNHQRSLGAGSGSGTPKRPSKLAANRIFDILPIKGCMMPGDTELVTVSYYAHPNYRCKCTAVCEVEGGPDYELALEAESSLIKYALDRTSIDFGAQPFGRAIDRDFTLHNSGRVPVDFKLDLSGVNKASHLQVGPLKGHVAAGERQRFLVRFVPTVPDKFVERFTIEVAHFEPHEFVIYGEGIYPCVRLNLPRFRTEQYDALKEEARKKLVQAGPPRSIVPSPAGSRGNGALGHRESHLSRMRPESNSSRSKRSSINSKMGGNRRNPAEKSVMSDADGAALAAEAQLLDPAQPGIARPRVSPNPESGESGVAAEITPRAASPGHIIGMPLPPSLRPKLNGTSEYDGLGARLHRKAPGSEKSFSARVKNGPGSILGTRQQLQEVYVPTEEEVEAEADRMALVETLREERRSKGEGKVPPLNLLKTGNRWSFSVECSSRSTTIKARSASIKSGHSAQNANGVLSDQREF
jgi:hydrocephalus-inducing protein